ncbi:MAG: recombinase family protein [Solobacterium sp.]|nr:recombinase family protein [Solobacterium sp.]
MAYIPYGYRIRNGKAVIIEEEKKKVEILFEAYINGKSIENSGKTAGIDLSKRTIGSILKNPIYLGNQYYPQIIDEESFSRAQEIRQKRYKALGSFSARKPGRPYQIQFKFRMDPPELYYEDPAEEAEYLYSLIRRKEEYGS